MIKTNFSFAVVLLFSLEIVSGINTKIYRDVDTTARSYDPVLYRYDYEFNEEAKGWLKLHVVPATWQDARLLCHAEGAVLSSPLTNQLKEAIIKFVSNQMPIKSPKMIFTGVHATFSQGDYNSIEGVPLSRLPVTWAAGEPDNLDNSESCLVMDAANEGAMADTSCANVFPFVCYKFKIGNVQNECGTTDPEYRLHAATGSCYKLHWSPKAWSGAFRACAGEGALLAILNSEEEARYLGSLIKGIWAHIGFHDWGSHSSDWMTIKGETLTEAGYAKWKSGEPNNMTYSATGDAGEFCGSMSSDGELNDVPCNVPYPFLCELTPGSLVANGRPTSNDSE